MARGLLSRDRKGAVTLLGIPKTVKHPREGAAAASFRLIFGVAQRVQQTLGATRLARLAQRPAVMDDLV